MTIALIAITVCSLAFAAYVYFTHDKIDERKFIDTGNISEENKKYFINILNALDNTLNFSNFSGTIIIQRDNQATIKMEKLESNKKTIYKNTIDGIWPLKLDLNKRIISPLKYGLSLSSSTT